MVAENNSSGDDFLELRFDPKYKQIFQEQFSSPEAPPIERDYNIPIEFSGSFDDKSKTILSNLVHRVFSNAQSQNLKLENTDPRVVFFSIETWKKKNRNQNELNLPASMISWQAGYPAIQVIIPNRIESYEVMIKTVRLLFSKLFGTLYFNENIFSRKPFKSFPFKKEGVFFDNLEKMHFCRMLDDFPKPAKVALGNLSENFRLKKGQTLEFGKKEFFRRIEEDKGAPDPSLEALLEETFAFHINKVEENRNEFLQNALDKVFSSIPKIGLILPHEEKAYKLLQHRKQWSIFDGITEKLQIVVTSIQDLKDCFQYLEAHKEMRISDFSESDYWLKILNSRINYLKRKKLVKLFLIENSLLTSDQKREQLEFPLWIWRHRIFENFPGKIKPEKVIQLISNQYKGSIYQKLFESAFRAVNCFQAFHRRMDLKLESIPDFKRLRALMNGIELRLPIINDLLHTCRICSQLSFDQKEEIEDKEKTIGDFEQGWSYFISFALIHQFYLQKSRDKNEKAGRFLDIIRQYLEKRIEKQIRFQISYLFLLIYQISDHQLAIPVKIIKEGSETMDFYILNQKEIARQNTGLKEILESYAQSILKST
jgi:hypothetical protein